jgi:hypothetical protein
VQETLSVSADEAFLLLVQYKWKPPLIEDRWFSDTAATRAAAGVSEGPDPPALPPEAATEPMFMDPVSLDEYPWDAVDSLPCGHWFSSAAWRNYINTALSDRDVNPMDAVRLKCLNDGCTEVGTVVGIAHAPALGFVGASQTPV